MRRLSAALLACLIPLPLPLQADAVHPTLMFPQNLAPELQGLPRLAGDDAIERKINASLQTEDKALLSSRQDCIKEPVSDFSSWSDVTLSGPEFLSIRLTISYYCGGFHPDSGQSVLLFDLKTGDRLDPMTLLPHSLQPDTTSDSASTATDAALAGIPALTALYLSRATLDPSTDADCLHSLASYDHLSFLVWPDAKAHALMLMPNGMAYVDTPCQNPVAIPVELLLKLHASPRLILSLAR